MSQFTNLLEQAGFEKKLEDSGQLIYDKIMKPSLASGIKARIHLVFDEASFESSTKATVNLAVASESFQYDKANELTTGFELFPLLETDLLDDGLRKLWTVVASFQYK